MTIRPWLLAAGRRARQVRVAELIRYLGIVAVVLLGGFGLARCTLRSPVVSSPGDRMSGAPAFLDESFLGRPHAHLLFGTAIGAWPMLDGRYDGHPMLDYNGSCPNCPQLARAAQISVVRWGIWNAFEGMPPPPGQTAPPLTRAQFDSVIDGIRVQLGAVPLVNLPPGGSEPASLLCPARWGDANLLELDREIIRQAGSRVLLYELGNEPELACSLSRDAGTAGADAAGLWTTLAPSLRKTARSLGYEIYLGGPGFTTTHVNPRNDDLEDLRMVRVYMQAIKDRYEDSRSPSFHDADLIPTLLSFHAYATEYLANGGARALDAIPRYAAYLAMVRTTIDDVWGATIGPHIRIACTEWNYATDDFVDWSSPDVPVYFSQFLSMLGDGDVYLATQFLVGSNGNRMDMITLDGRPTPYYQAFKAASLAAHSAPR